MTFPLKREKEEERHRVGFTGASYCGRGTIEQFDFAEVVFVLAVGTDLDDDDHDYTYITRMGTLPVQFASVCTINEAILCNILHHYREAEDSDGIVVLEVCPAAVGALHFVDEIVSSNYVVFNLQHSDVDIAIEQFVEYGRTAIASQPQRKKND